MWVKFRITPISPMLRTLGHPLLAHKTDSGGGSCRFPTPTTIGIGETIYLPRELNAAEHGTFLWKGEIYRCPSQDLLTATGLASIHMTEDNEKITQTPDEACTADRMYIAALACQLANGAKYTPGDWIPVGWNDSRERVFVTVTPEMLARASAEARV